MPNVLGVGFRWRSCCCDTIRRLSTYALRRRREWLIQTEDDGGARIRGTAGLPPHGRLKGGRRFRRVRTTRACGMRAAPALRTRPPLRPVLRCRGESERKARRPRAVRHPMPAKRGRSRGLGTLRRPERGALAPGRRFRMRPMLGSAVRRFARVTRALLRARVRRAPMLTVRARLRPVRRRRPCPCARPHLATRPRMPPPMTPTCYSSAAASGSTARSS